MCHIHSVLSDYHTFPKNNWSKFNPRQIRYYSALGKFLRGSPNFFAPVFIFIVYFYSKLHINTWIKAFSSTREITVADWTNDLVYFTQLSNLENVQKEALLSINFETHFILFCLSIFVVLFFFLWILSAQSRAMGIKVTSCLLSFTSYFASNTFCR